jgi:hypothetical protein
MSNPILDGETPHTWSCDDCEYIKECENTSDCFYVQNKK